MSHSQKNEFNDFLRLKSNINTKRRSPKYLKVAERLRDGELRPSNLNDSSRKQLELLEMEFLSFMIDRNVSDSKGNELWQSRNLLLKELKSANHLATQGFLSRALQLHSKVSIKAIEFGLLDLMIESEDGKLKACLLAGETRKYRNLQAQLAFIKSHFYQFERANQDFKLLMSFLLRDEIHEGKLVMQQLDHILIHLEEFTDWGLVTLLRQYFDLLKVILNRESSVLDLKQAYFKIGASKRLLEYWGVISHPLEIEIVIAKSPISWPMKENLVDSLIRKINHLSSVPSLIRIENWILQLEQCSISFKKNEMNAILNRCLEWRLPIKEMDDWLWIKITYYRFLAAQLSHENEKALQFLEVCLKDSKRHPKRHTLFRFIKIRSFLILKRFENAILDIESTRKYCVRNSSGWRTEDIVHLLSNIKRFIQKEDIEAKLEFDALLVRRSKSMGIDCRALVSLSNSSNLLSA